MKKLTECPIGCIATVTKIHTTGPLKQRLISLGIMKGAALTLLAHSIAKGTFEIKVGKMQLALRREEAEAIEVEA